MNAPRCKPGDLARYIGKYPPCIGWIVQCISLHADGTAVLGSPVWVVEPPMPSDCGTRFADGCADFLLQPLGNPGADEVDEMVLRVRVPTADEVPA